MEKKRYDKIGEELITHTLPNGLRINIVQKPEHNKSFAMFATDYGGADRRFKLGGQWIDTPAGVAHFLEHKMFDMPDGNALNTLSANGASPNAFTSAGMTAYYFESAGMFYENLKVLLEFVSTPYFSAESVSKEQGIIAQEIRMVEDDPDHAVYTNLMRCLYEHNPVRDTVAGTVESIAEITDETLYKCHQVFYNPSNMSLAVIGNVDPERIIAMAEELLPAEAGERPERDYGLAESGLPNKKEISVQMEVSAPQFILGSSIVPEKGGRERLKQQLTGEIALRMLFGRASALYTSLYAEGLLNGSFEYELDYTAGTAMTLVAGESRDIPTVMERLHAYVAGISESGLDEKLFENAKKARFGGALRLLDSFSSLSQALVSGDFAGYCPLDAFDIIGEIGPEEVRRFIAAHFAPEKLALSVVSSSNGASA